VMQELSVTICGGIDQDGVQKESAARARLRLDKEAKASVCNVIYYKNLPSTVIQEKSLEIGQDWS
jgi:hypothetical protein